MIVFRIADGDDVVRRELKFLECFSQAGRLVDARGQHHDRVLVEDHLQLQPKVANRLQYHGLMGSKGPDDRLTHAHSSNTPLAKSLHEFLGWRGSQKILLALGRAIEHSSVLGDNAIEDFQIWTDRAKI